MFRIEECISPSVDARRGRNTVEVRSRIGKLPYHLCPSCSAPLWSWLLCLKAALLSKGRSCCCRLTCAWYGIVPTIAAQLFPSQLQLSRNLQSNCLKIYRTHLFTRHFFRYNGRLPCISVLTDLCVQWHFSQVTDFQLFTLAL